MTQDQDRPFFRFPRWTDTVGKIVFATIGVGAVYLTALAVYAFSPKTVDVGYMPTQPVPYSHKMHAGELGMDCRYCHNTVEESAFSSIPPTQTCMNCHAMMNKDSDKLQAVRESYATGLPVPWVRVHKLSEFAYFNHSAHVRRGVGCASCHGRIDKMEVVYKAKPLRMRFCLDCHRHPEKFLRPKDLITKMDYDAGDEQITIGLKLKKEYNINPSTDCSTCHR